MSLVVIHAVGLARLLCSAGRMGWSGVLLLLYVVCPPLIKMPIKKNKRVPPRLTETRFVSPFVGGTKDRSSIVFSYSNNAAL